MKKATITRTELKKMWEQYFNKEKAKQHIKELEIQGGVIEFDTMFPPQGKWNDYALLQCDETGLYLADEVIDVLMETMVQSQLAIEAQCHDIAKKTTRMLNAIEKGKQKMEDVFSKLEDIAEETG